MNILYKTKLLLPIAITVLCELYDYVVQRFDHGHIDFVVSPIKSLKAVVLSEYNRDGVIQIAILSFLKCLCYFLFFFYFFLMIDHHHHCGILRE